MYKDNGLLRSFRVNLYDFLPFDTKNIYHHNGSLTSYFVYIVQQEKKSCMKKTLCTDLLGFLSRK